ncbi:MAG: 2-phosphosulfolactate phosphatase, partial [Candidatus Latescibacterota bacterium]
STTVEVAVARGAWVYPYRFRDDKARAFAVSLGAELAGPRGPARFSLSPHSMLAVESGTRIVLPSPNGATLSLAAGAVPTLAGCLRNAAAVAAAATRIGALVAVVPAGERWPDNGLRPALEDWLGAGAIIARLPGARSPEAQAAVDAFLGAKDDLSNRLLACGSGRELEEYGRTDDMQLAACLDVSRTVPQLVDGAYTDSSAAS